jgi:antitoxin component YwqK of YwqJK toxin-antitoxin module
MEKKTYANGQRVYEAQGDCLTYYFKNGRVKADGRIENGQMVGEWKFYRETGQLWQVGHFRLGKKNGSWIRYDKNGSLEHQEEFLDNKKARK